MKAGGMPAACIIKSEEDLGGTFHGSTNWNSALPLYCISNFEQFRKEAGDGDEPGAVEAYGVIGARIAIVKSAGSYVWDQKLRYT